MVRNRETMAFAAEGLGYGLTKQEYFAIEIFSRLYANAGSKNEDVMEHFVKHSFKAADKMLEFSTTGKFKKSNR